MTGESIRGRDYQPDESMVATSVPDDSVDYVVVMPTDLRQSLVDGQPDRWTALWHGPTAPRGEFEGAYADALAWSKARSSHVYLYSTETQDVTLLRDT